ncbi:hsp90 co-chaperone Cdc37-like [Pecten maximus]|uniref:hsp90 co-chaperone Cdc37-like n=1 Tax=Pecten maximus TaxID=6579 RepID=UPI001458ADFA|nr:hsp90 co-chaperone Cdc37-like [Pecten maximus]
MSCVNYSKWDHIEISDDEDDTHPNIDTGSLFRWRHQARVERMEEQKKEKDAVEKGLTQQQKKVEELKTKIKAAEEKDAADQLSKLKIDLKDLEEQEKKFKEKEEELKKKEKLTPLNIDTICHDGKSKTVINKLPARKKDMTDEEKAEKQEEFQKKYKDDVKKFGMLKKYEDSQQLLTDKPHLVCEETANYLVIWCIDLEVEGKHDLMHHVAHQTIVMNFIMELSKNMDIDPRACVRPFFSKIKLEEPQYMEAFKDELEAFKERVRGRAKVRIDTAVKEYEEEERKKRLGPGGEDPVEVFESLPEAMKECFEAKDIPMLQKVISEMDHEEASYHLKRCIDSGLWVPEANKEPAGAGEEGDEEVEYAEVSDMSQNATSSTTEKKSIDDVD